MKKKKVSIGSDVNNIEVPKQKERHIVSWSQEEDDILRDQIGVHGTENWGIIASKFKDKTTRQCRRRWFTYLNSDFKKGGWSSEEDMLLCEAQKIFGNRWTEIAKVVSGRTDNAVKNRFTTLCKKREKRAALSKEKNTTSSYINLNNKRVIFPNGLSTDRGSETGAPLKKMRTCISNTRESQEEILAGENVHISENKKIQGTFIRKDDPKMLALMQQAELLSSLAIKVNLECKTDQSLESAWTALQDFMKQNKESELLAFGNAGTLEKLKESVEDLRSSNEGSRPSWSEHDNVCESSPASSEYSTGSTLLPYLPNNKTEENGNELQPDQLDDQPRLAEESRIWPSESTNQVDILTCNNIKNDSNEDAAVREYSNAEFDSPGHVTPLFRAVAAAIPTPEFSESNGKALLNENTGDGFSFSKHNH
ncbi:SANT SWI3, ADA2, N-CoR and TFIIIB'' DNA-binding domain protein [Orobanche minor]